MIAPGRARQQQATRDLVPTTKLHTAQLHDFLNAINDLSPVLTPPTEKPRAWPGPCGGAEDARGVPCRAVPASNVPEHQAPAGRIEQEVCIRLSYWIAVPCRVVRAARAR